MNKEMIKTSKYEGWMVSILLHGVLSLIFLFVVFEKPIDISEYSNLTFSNFNPVNLPVVEDNQLSPSPPMPAVLSSPRSTQPRSAPITQPKRNVDLPSRRMSEHDVNKIPVETQGQLVTSDNSDIIDTKRRTLHGVNDNLTSIDKNILNATRPGTKPSDKSVGQKVDAVATPGEKGGDVQFEKPYIISWQGVNRGGPIKELLPEYPEGVNVEGSVNIKITVLPDGTMGDLIITKKLDATLEAEVLKAMKLWRFRALRADEPQVNQTATITYNFELQ